MNRVRSNSEPKKMNYRIKQAKSAQSKNLVGIKTEVTNSPDLLAAYKSRINECIFHNSIPFDHNFDQDGGMGNLSSQS